MKVSEPMALLGRLRDRGMEVCVRGDRICYRPASAMTPELAEDVVRLKAELLDLFGRQNAREQVVQRLTARAVTTRVVVLRQFPLILDWTARSAPNLFHNQKQNGLNLADTWDSYVLGFADRPTLERDLELWVEELERGPTLTWRSSALSSAAPRSGASGLATRFRGGRRAVSPSSSARTSGILEIVREPRDLAPPQRCPFYSCGPT